MCDPVSATLFAVGTAASAGGGIMKQNDAMSGAQNAANARNGVLNAFLGRQEGYSKEARGFFDKNMAGFAPGAQAEGLANAQGARTGNITSNLTAGDPGSIPLSGSAPKVVRGEIAKRMSATFDAALERAKATGKLGGYGDQWFGNNLGVADAGRNIGTINNFARGDASILGAEQDLAERAAYKPPSIWGPILQAGGQMMAGMAGRGMGAGGGATPPIGGPVNLYGSTSANAIY